MDRIFMNLGSDKPRAHGRVPRMPYIPETNREVSILLIIKILWPKTFEEITSCR